MGCPGRHGHARVSPDRQGIYRALGAANALVFPSIRDRREPAELVARVSFSRIGSLACLFPRGGSRHGFARDLRGFYSGAQVDRVSRTLEASGQQV